MLETNERAAKARFGDTNVESDQLGNMTITHNGLPTDQASWVFEISLTGNRADRLVIPSASISEAAEITYNLSDAKGWGVTLAANADSRIDGGTSREYIAALIDDFDIVTTSGNEAPSANMTVDGSQTLAVNVQVEGKGEVKITEGFTVTSSDDQTVQASGTTITAKKAGKATVTVTVGGTSKSFEITVDAA